MALAAALDTLYGSGTIVVFIAIFILLTHQNLQYMLASRILYALSVDGLGSAQATAVSEKGTPSGAVLITWVLSVLLILAGGFEFLLNMTVLMFMLMYISLLIGIFKLRRQEPDAERPYVAWAFPASGIICIIGWAAITVFVGFNNPLSALYALGLIVVSIPAYLWLKSKRHLGTS